MSNFYLGIVIGVAVLAFGEMTQLIAVFDNRAHLKSIADSIERIASALEALERR